MRNKETCVLFCVRKTGYLCVAFLCADFLDATLKTCHCVLLGVRKIRNLCVLGVRKIRDLHICVVKC